MIGINQNSKIKLIVFILGISVLGSFASVKDIQSLQQPTSISGKVIDPDGQPLPGVTIMLKGTSYGTATDQNGNYILSNVPNNSVLIYSFIGMTTNEIEVKNRSNINVTMEYSSIGLEEVVAIGYGSIKKGQLTGSVGTIKGKDLENIPGARIEGMLQGRVAGIQVTQIDGRPGIGSLVRIRGGNSIKGDNDPLYVVDGYIMGTGYNLNNINTNDVQSIDVLKDATAIAIYGTRGSNGVILITTKSGRGVDKPRITFNAYHGVQHMIKDIKLLDGKQHATWANEAFEFIKSPPAFTDLDNVPNVDWVGALTQKGSISNVDISMAGKSSDSKIDYYISGNYFDQQGIVKSSGFNRYSLNSKLNIDISDKVKAGLNINASRSLVENAKVLYRNVLLQGLPNKNIYDVDGNYTTLNPVSSIVQRNPVADIDLKEDHNIRSNIFGAFYFEIEPIRNLHLKSTLGTEMNFSKSNVYNPGLLPENSYINAGGDGSVSESNSLDVLNENTITYNTNFGVHRLDFLGGFTWQKRENEYLTSSAYGFSNDALKYNNLAFGSDPLRNAVGSSWGDYSLVSWLGRANYGLKNKYLFTFVGRVDGSSRFATAKNKYAFFPSVGTAWRMDEEPFIKRLNIFNMMKLRGSFGLSGSQGIGSYRALSVLNGTKVYFNDIPHSAVVSGRPANSDLKWETTQQLDIGFEVALFKNRLSLEVDYYRKKTTDLLLDVEIPYQTGYTTKLQNLGEIANNGLEFTLNSTNVATKNFQWLSTFIISGNRTKVLDLAGSDYIDLASPTDGGVSARLIVGQPAPVFVGVQYLGTWKSQEDIDASGQAGQFLGGPRFKDTNDDKFIDIDDFDIIGSPQPKFIGSLQNTFVWKNFELDIYFQGTYGNDVFNTFTQQAYFGRPESNKYVEVLDRWSPENPTSDIPAAGTILTIATARSNTVNIEDGSHLRLKNLRFTYNIPTKKMGLNVFQNLSVYVSGANLLLFSDFRLGDPETNRYGTDNIVYGYASGEYPHGRTYMFGIKATL